MRTIRALLLACFLPILAALTVGGCSTAPSERTATFQTLSTVGLSAKAGLDACAVLLKNGQITLDEWRKVAAFYSNRFQPAFTLAVSAARSDLSGAASPDLVALAGQFAALVSTYTTRTP